jgi:hypothetical protein
METEGRFHQFNCSTQLLKKMGVSLCLHRLPKYSDKFARQLPIFGSVGEFITLVPSPLIV